MYLKFIFSFFDKNKLAKYDLRHLSAIKKKEENELRNHVTTLISHCAFNIQEYIRTFKGFSLSCSEAYLLFVFSNMFMIPVR